jgi:NADH-quinone oxidoreductase subunit B
MTTLSDALYNGSKSKLTIYPFISSCCCPAWVEASDHDGIAPINGHINPEIAPEKTNLLLVMGPVTDGNLPELLDVYHRMMAEKWVIAAGICTCSGGLFDTSSGTIPGLDHVLPVDIYIPGCPPTSEQLVDGIMLLQEKPARDLSISS